MTMNYMKPLYWFLDFLFNPEKNVILKVMSNSERIIKIIVKVHDSVHEISLPAESTFGNVKRLLAPKIGLEPEEQVLIFQGKQKHDEQHLHLEGVCDNSEIYLLNFVSSSRGRQPEEMRENVGMPEAFEAVARVRAEVDQLSESVDALEVAIKCGTNVAESAFLTLSEFLMRQLLKLDAIQTEGEARLQRKAEVCRVQSIVEKLDSLKVLNSMPSSNNDNTLPDENGDTSTSQTGSTNAPPTTSPAVEFIQDFEQQTLNGSREFELQVADEAEYPGTSEALIRRRGRRINSGAQVQERTDRRARPGVSELRDPPAPSQPDIHVSFSNPTGDFHAHTVKYPQIEEVIPEISQFPEQMPFRILVDNMDVPSELSFVEDTCFFYPRTPSFPAHVSTSEDHLESVPHVNVGEILRHNSHSPAIREATASVPANVAKDLSVLCELDDEATKRLQIAFHKYPNLMTIRSDRRTTFIRWMFSSLSNLLQLLSTTATTGNLDSQKKSEIEVVLGELKTFGFDAGFIEEMHSQVNEAWEAQLEVNNAPSELKILLEKAEDLNQEIARLETSLAAAKTQAAQVEDRISTLCGLIEVQENRSSVFKWIE